MNESRTESPRSRYWLGFSLTFALLALASCAALFVASGLNEVSLAELQGSGPAWTPPPVTPTPVATSLTEADAALTTGDGRFQAGQRLRNVTNSRVNVRATAGYLTKPPSDVLGQLAPSAAVEIMGPSAIADGLNWWRVRGLGTDGVMLEGWVAEATASGVTILGE